MEVNKPPTPRRLNMDAVAMEDNKTATGECDSLAAMSDEEEYLAMQLEEVK